MTYVNFFKKFMIVKNINNVEFFNEFEIKCYSNNILE